MSCDKVIFSYCRVSTSEQDGKGKSGLDNQQHINDAAIEHLMKTDDFTLLEPVVEVGSAYKGSNLSGVLEDAKRGDFPSGSIMVLMDQTRFSRSSFRDAIDKMYDLVDTGLKIHFSSTGQTIGADNIEDFGTHITVLATMKASNDESKIKSNRNHASYSRSVEKGENIYVGRLPNWLEHTYDTSGSKPIINGFKVREDRRTVIETIYNQYNSGVGATGITKLLNKTVTPWSEYDNKRIDKNNRVWRESYISKLLVNRALIGERVFYKGRDNEKIEADYYPPAISKEMFYQAEEIRKNRGKGSSGGFKYKTNFYAGLVYCGYCGSKCGVQNFNNGRLSTLRCTAKAKCEVSTDICAGGTSGSRFLEQVLIEFCSDKINYNSIFNTQKTDVSELKLKHSQLGYEVNKLSVRLDRLEDLYLDGMALDRYNARKGNLDDDLLSKQKELGELARDIERLTHTETTDELDFIELLFNVKDNEIPEEIRLKLRDLLPLFISRIDYYRFSSDWVSQRQLDQYSEHLNQFSDNLDMNDSVFKDLEAKTIKNKEVITYGIHFKNGYYRKINYNQKTKTWVSMSDNSRDNGNKWNFKIA